MRVITLRTGREFRAAYRTGRNSGCALFGVKAYRLAAQGEPSRVGIVVSRKVGNAVVRNKLRRRLKEIWRVLLSGGFVRPGKGVVIIARPAAAAANFSSIRNQLLAALKRLNVLPGGVA